MQRRGAAPTLKQQIRKCYVTYLYYQFKSGGIALPKRQFCSLAAWMAGTSPAMTAEALGVTNGNEDSSADFAQTI